MEESVTWQFDSLMEEMFEMREADVKEYSPLVVNEGNQPVQKLHLRTSRFVQASAQSRMMRVLQEELTEEEHAVYKRGRNAKSVSPAKNQSVTDYRRATGFEALLGYLYLKKEWKRMLSLVKMGLESIEDDR